MLDLFLLNFMINKKIKRYYKNLKNYFSSTKKAKKSVGQLSKETVEGELLTKFISNNDIRNVLEIGTWNGLGSTKTIHDALLKNSPNFNFISIESDKIFYKQALINLDKYLGNNFQILLGRIIEIDELPHEKDIDFEKFGFNTGNKEWLVQDLRRYKKIKNIYNKLPKNFDLILLDGGEFSTLPEFLKLYKKTRFICLDDTDTYKQYEVLKFINKNSQNFIEIIGNNRFSIYEVIHI